MRNMNSVGSLSAASSETSSVLSGKTTKSALRTGSGSKRSCSLRTRFAESDEHWFLQGRRDDPKPTIRRGVRGNAHSVKADWDSHSLHSLYFTLLDQAVAETRGKALSESNRSVPAQRSVVDKTSVFRSSCKLSL
eukprot:TRINITY_DN62743_c0_g1_i1.p2 TRINITY_DN62743_c0_g1~~TRINITY_DN62743_c0_g1_i1.p2  ORF type:complete len:135 (-),score=15.05 TRINITY_DN62743_c0_g1_i1:15-419(-)